MKTVNLNEYSSTTDRHRHTLHVSITVSSLLYLHGPGTLHVSVSVTVSVSSLLYLHDPRRLGIVVPQCIERRLANTAQVLIRAPRGGFHFIELVECVVVGRSVRLRLGREEGLGDEAVVRRIAGVQEARRTLGKERRGKERQGEERRGEERREEEESREET